MKNKNLTNIIFLEKNRRYQVHFCEGLGRKPKLSPNISPTLNANHEVIHVCLKALYTEKALNFYKAFLTFSENFFCLP